MENTEDNRYLVAEVIASEYTEDELRGLVVNSLVSDLKADGGFFEKCLDRNPEMVTMVKIAKEVLNISVREAIEEYDTSPSNLQRLIREEKKKIIKTFPQ